MEEEVVRRRAWMSREEFLDLLGATNLIPGPNSTEMAIHIGFRRAGWPGLLVAGLSFVLPAVAIVWGLAWAYVTYGYLPAAQGLLYGTRPVLLAILLQALWSLGRSALKSRLLAFLGVACVAMVFAGKPELAVLFASGLLTALVALLGRVNSERRPPGATALALLAWLPSGRTPLLLGGVALGVPFQLSTLFLVFLKIGSVLFGSGYVLLSLLRTELVVRLGWLSEAQLLDAVTIGQVTPGPVFSCATFVGYLLGKSPGALAATAGIFLPAFFFVAVSGPLVPRLRRSPVAGAFLDGVNVASLALIGVVTFRLLPSAVLDATTTVLAALSALLLFRYRTNPSWLLLGGALVGLLAANLGLLSA